MNTKHSGGGRGIKSALFLGYAILLCVSGQAFSATAPALGTTSTHAVVSSTLNNTNPTTITGDTCYTSLSGPIPAITGTATIPCPPATGVDQGAALANLNGQICTSLGGGSVALNTINLGSGAGVFPPGCYSSGGTMSVAAGTVQLNGPGVYIFRSSGTLTMANNTSVTLSGGACANDVFWAPQGATTFGSTIAFVGNLLDGVANAVTIGVNANIVGRILAFGGVVTISTDSITKPTCTTVVPSIPSLSQWAVYAIGGLIALMAMFGIMQRRRQA